MDHAVVKDKLRVGAEGTIHPEEPWAIRIIDIDSARRHVTLGYS